MRSRGLGDVYKRQLGITVDVAVLDVDDHLHSARPLTELVVEAALDQDCLLYTSDAADERSSVDLGGRRIIKKKKRADYNGHKSTVKTNTNSQ